MKSSIPGARTLLVVVATVLFVVAGCSSSDDTGSTETTTTAADAEDAVADPLIAEQWATSLTGLPMEESNVTCMMDRADGDTTLTSLFATPTAPNPDQFSALAGAVHQCVDNDDLAESLLDLSGADTPAQEEAFTSCIAEQISAEGQGDLAYAGLSALSRAVDVPPGAYDATIAAGQTCQSAEGLVNLFAISTEQASQFTLEVDRECLAEQVDAEFLDSYWPNLVRQDDTGPDLGAAMEDCVSTYDSGLPKEIPSDFVAWSGDGTLAGVDPATRNAVYDEAPPMSLEPGVDYQAVLTTEDGEIVVDLLEDVAPVTVNNFVSLARDGFYDLTVFHRVIEGFMAQGGDPTATGSGGPGYTFADEADGLTPVDRRGLLAMANGGADTNGSQFFITFEPATHLDGLHTVFGEVIDGDDVLAAIDIRNPEQPTSRGQVLLSVEIVEA